MVDKNLEDLSVDAVPTCNVDLSVAVPIISSDEIIPSNTEVKFGSAVEPTAASSVSVPSDHEIIEQMNSIQEEQKKALFVGEKKDIADLVEEYARGTETMAAKVKYLSENYKYIRRVRGDGNCFVRAFAFGLLSHLQKPSNKASLDAVTKYFEGSFQKLVQEGFSDYIEDFWEILMDELKELKNDTNSETTEAQQQENIFEHLNDDSTSNYIVCYLRFIISAYLKRNAEEYQNFISDNCTVAEFCIREVEPMGLECDHLQIMGITNPLSESLQASIQIEYLDNSESTTTNHILFPDGLPPFLYLLYRPGHYDILYKS